MFFEGASLEDVSLAYRRKKSLMKPDPRKSVPHKAAMHRHAKKRLRSRYGIKPTKRILSKLVKAVLNNKCDLIEKQNQFYSIFEYTISGKRVRFVYDVYQKAIVTFLPKETVGT